MQNSRAHILSAKLLAGLWFFSIISMVPGVARCDSVEFRTITLAYDVFIGGILVGSTDITLHAEAAGYRITSKERSHGFLDFLIAFRGRNEVHGIIMDGRPKPKAYNARGTWSGEVRTVAIQYGDDNRLRYQAFPNAENDQREPVPEHLLPGTTNPLSALYSAMTWASRSPRCGRREAVFDGRRRYDIILQELPGGATKGPFFTGAARVCRARRVMLAGASLRKWLPQFARPEWTNIWIATVRPDIPALPVRFQADLGIADMVGHLVAIGGRKHPPGGKDLDAAAGSNRQTDEHSK